MASRRERTVLSLIVPVGCRALELECKRELIIFFGFRTSGILGNQKV